MLRIQPYKPRSRSAKALGETLGVLRTTPKQVRKHGDFDKIINWGSSEERFNGRYYNDPRRVADASCKQTTLEVLARADVPTTPFTTDRDTAQAWWDDGEVVVCRKLLRASQGRGMLLAASDTATPLVRAPLYTCYVKKADEYRVHVVNGKVIDVMVKRKRREVPNDEVNYQVRNKANGWVFCRDDMVVPDSVSDAALRAVTALGLDFGGVDVGYNQHTGTPTVYEVNTAPGLEGTTLLRYREAFEELIPELQRGAYRRRRGD